MSKNRNLRINSRFPSYRCGINSTSVPNWNRDFSLRFQKSRAFTLIEVLVASILICVFAGSFTFLVNGGIRQVNYSRQLTRSIFIAKSMMEEMRSKPFDSLFSYSNSRFDNGAGSITVSPAGNDLISIKVSHKVELNTLRSRY